MHDDVLILPDGGADFMETVRLSALYADKVHVFSPTAQPTIDALQSLLAFSFPSPSYVDDNLDELIAANEAYTTFLKKHPHAKSLVADQLRKNLCDHPGKDYLLKTIGYRPELALLKSEGVLISITDDLVASQDTFGQYATGYFETLQSSVSQLKHDFLPASLIPESLYKGDAAKADPSITFLVEGLFTALLEVGDSMDKLPDELIETLDKDEYSISKISVGLYFILSSFYASQRGCVGVTSHVDARNCYDRCAESLTYGRPEHSQRMIRRDRIKTLLGEAILQDTVPDVSSMPLDEILTIRRKRQPELESFREGLNQLAAGIDPSLGDDELRLAIDAKILTVVRPALGDMRRAIEELRIDSYSSLARDTLVAGGVPFALASHIGTTGEISPTELGAAGVLVKKLYDFTLGRYVKKRKLLASKKWSVLFHLKNR